MSPSPPRPEAQDLSALLEYLGEMGFEGLYVPLKHDRAAAGHPRRASDPPPFSKGGPRGSFQKGKREAPAPVPTVDTLPGTLEEVAAVADQCRACKLCQRRQKVVFGVGNPRAELMLIGEGPGAQEDRQGLPFVGPAGQLLTKILKSIDLERDQVYITNVVKCRPPGNRDPEPEEVATCRPYLEKQIQLVQPKLIVALGRVAAQTLLGTDQALGRLRGTWWQVLGVPTRATYHPAALLRNTRFKRPTWEDMQLIQQRLRESKGE